MSRKPISMRKVKDVLRLKFDLSLSERQIADTLHMGRSTVQDYLTRADEAHLEWSTVKNLSENELEQKLFPRVIYVSECNPSWGLVHLEHRKKHVTLQVLWEEYKEQSPDGYSYSYFCDLYQKYTQTVEISMRQIHKAGDKLFVDYCGSTIGIIDKTTGEICPAQVFVAVLGASNYLYYLNKRVSLPL